MAHTRDHRLDDRSLAADIFFPVNPADNTAIYHVPFYCFHMLYGASAEPIGASVLYNIDNSKGYATSILK
jgi:hypothetical protein